MTIEITIETNQSTPALAALVASLEDPTGLHVAMAARGERLMRDYLRAIAPGRHATANRLGARPTGILEKAAESPEGRGSVDGATVTIRPGEVLSRTFGEVTIRPTGGKRYLTIPVAAEAYGRRAREFDDLKFIRIGPQQIPVLARRMANGNMVVYYALAREVKQKQDRTLLPSDDAILEEMESAAGDVLLASWERQD